MAWWGKAIGGVFGYLLGGPIGALFGGAVGHGFDLGLERVREQIGWQGRVGDQERVQAVFFTTTFSLMGYLAKADGRVSEGEIQVAEQVMAHMRLSPDQRRAAIRLFGEGKAPDFDLDGVLAQFRSECRGRRNLVQMLLEILLATAMADGTLDPAERRALQRITAGLGFPRGLFERLVEMVEARQRFAGAWTAGGGGAPRGPRAAPLEDAYRVLGLNPGASDAEVKRAYRRLMSQHHPDKLVARGLPEEMQEIAKEKTQEIRAAYDRIREARGLK